MDETSSSISYLHVYLQKYCMARRFWLYSYSALLHTDGDCTQAKSSYSNKLKVIAIYTACNRANEVGQAEGKH